MFATERIAQIVENCQTLVREESLSGQESGVVRAIEAMMRAYGFDEINIDRYGNIVGGLVGSRPGKTVVFDGHIDTVPYDAEKWTRAPLGGVVADGRIYGRGTTDMKGSVSAMIGASAAADALVCSGTETAPSWVSAMSTTV